MRGQVFDLRVVPCRHCPEGRSVGSSMVLRREPGMVDEVCWGRGG